MAIVRLCFCGRRAVWRWRPAHPLGVYHPFLCDDHAGNVDGNELEGL